MTSILIVDDDRSLCESFKGKLSQSGYDVTCAHTLSDGLDLAAGAFIDLVLLDVRMPDGNGLDYIPRFRDTHCAPEIIIMTGNDEPDGAALAIEKDAWDYIPKNGSINDIVLSVTRALDYRRKKNSAAEKKIVLKRKNIIGDSFEFNECLDLVARASSSASNVMILGETGTGKELFARAIHENSDRANKAFVIVDCASVPENLFESILFGHTKGAFTSAEKTTTGLVEQADGGTLFLDEISELKLAHQKVLLRTLQERTYKPIGSVKERKSDFRLVAATNRELADLIETGNFRQDLLFRLQTVTIKLPPLNQRSGDVKKLTHHYLEKICGDNDIPVKGYSPEFMECLEKYHWPGNVRELVQSIEQAIVIAGDSQVLYPIHLPKYLRADLAKKSLECADPAPPVSDQSDKLPSFKEYKTFALDKAEKVYLTDLLAETNYNIKDAAGLSGLSQPRLYALLKKHDLPTKE